MQLNGICQVKAVFTHKLQSAYDDLPWERYHFPKTYLGQVQKAVGDLIVYYEPRREGMGDAAYRGRQAYFATARVTDVKPDLERAHHFYACVDQYLEFVSPVPFRYGTWYYERSLMKIDGTTNKGSFGRAVRIISDGEFEDIVRAGFAGNLSAPEMETYSGLQEQPVKPFWTDDQYPLERSSADRVITSRLFRDRAFSDAVNRAYDRTCAFTGLRLINGGGRTETQAAHIRPVEENGPDTVRNGLALGSTVHWLFDRGLISIAQDGSMLIKAERVPDQIQQLLHKDKIARLPEEPWLRPSPVFLQYHRMRHGFNST